MAETQADDEALGAWNPGIQSTLPAEFLPLSTMFRPENVFTSIETATELADFTGLSVQQVVRIRPQRLVVHELLIRVSADIFISDGSKYEDLGVNFREVAATIHRTYVEPVMPEIIQRFDELDQNIRAMVDEELSATLFSQSRAIEKNEGKFNLSRLFGLGKKPKKPLPSESTEMRHQRILACWEKKEKELDEPLSAAIYRALARAGNAINIKHGRLIGDKVLLTSLVSGFVCNDYVSELIGEMIAPCISEAAIKEGYRILPTQKEPVLINVKGASAAGKSTMRPLQHKHVEKLGLAWQDFALISPDIWRKYLLDYDSLGAASKYAGMLAGDEVPILDQKFDRYIEQKSKQGGLPHLLIDRFRFNSFAHGLGPEKGSNLLTRFGHTVYLVFLVTPPEATVERAWKRGLQVGRFKAVDDLLDHNIEAFKGIPNLFFTWALHKDKTVYYEFLDNGVAYGQKPRTIAFGKNGEMYILDFKCMFDIVRYTRINIEAGNPDEVYPNQNDMDAASNTDFLLQCAHKIPKINFVDPESKQIYASISSNKMTWLDSGVLKRMLNQPDVKAGLLAIAPKLIEELADVEHQQARPLTAELSYYTMGAIA